MTDIQNVNPNATLLRVRQVVNTDDIDFLMELSEDELIDMIFCACSFIEALKRVVPKGMIDSLMEMGTDFR